MPWTVEDAGERVGSNPAQANFGVQIEWRLHQSPQFWASCVRPAPRKSTWCNSALCAAKAP